MILVKDVMSKDVITIDLNESIKTSAEIMAKNNIGCLVVTKENKPYGMITERDLMKKVIAVNKDYGRLKVEDIMHVPLTMITQEISIIKATELIHNKGFRRLPILKDEKLVGIVTETDLTRALRTVLKDSLQTFIDDISK